MMCQNAYRVTRGPEGYLAPAASLMGVTLPDRGQALLEGCVVDERVAMDTIAVKLSEARNPFIFPGPLLLWDWSDGVRQKAQAVKELAGACGGRIIPMPDYRPKYPKIDPEAEINPNHPNLTIWHNAIDVCVFVGVHCHYANVALKMIRAGSDCYTVALCAESGHEDAMASLRDVDADKVRALARVVEQQKATVAS